MDGEMVVGGQTTTLGDNRRAGPDHDLPD